MTLKERFQKAWENKGQIVEGLWNTWVSNDKEIKAEAYRRITICKANTCGYWDETGESEKLVMRGSPGCTLCSCNGAIKTATMSAYCPLKDHEQTPLWDAVLTIEQEQEIQTTLYNNQFKQTNTNSDDNRSI